MHNKKITLIVAIFCLIVMIMAICSACEQIENNIDSPNTTQPHVHSFSSDWSKDELYHWQACIGCDEVQNKEEHDWNSGEVTTEPTNTTEGVKTFVCNTCAQSKTETISALLHIHTYDKAWKSDESYHWHASACEHSFLIIDKELHDWVDTGKIVTTPTDTIEGEKEQKCSVCERIRTVKIGTLGHEHTYSEKWSYDNDYHWRVAICEHTDIISDKLQHYWDEGAITTKPTVYDEGIKTYECKTCDAIKEESIPQIESFLVVFIDDNDTIISERNYELGTKNDKIVIPKTIEQDGYRFIGWKENTTAINITQFDFSDAKNNDVYYFKSIYEKAFSVVFKDYLGNELASIIKTESSNGITLEECPEIPEREGYTAHWDTQTLIGINKDTVITPIYQRITFEVVFKDQEGNILSYIDGNGNEVKKQIVAYNSFAIIPNYSQYYLDKTTMKFYEFSGWSDSFDSVKSNLEIVAQYNKLYEEPIIAIKIGDNKLELSIILPSNDTVLYALNLSFAWEVNKGTCYISDDGAVIRENSPLDKDSQSEHTCTAGNSNKWLSYNNKNHTFDFIWECGSGHLPNNTHLIEKFLTFNFSVYDNAEFNESIFTLLENSILIYGNTEDVTSLQTIKPLIWFYE